MLLTAFNLSLIAAHSDVIMPLDSVLLMTTDKWDNYVTVYLTMPLRRPTATV